MLSPATPASTASPAAPRSSRRWFFAGAVLASLLLAGASLWWIWTRDATPVLPAIDLTGMDPAVAQSISQALEQVRQEGRSGAAWGQLGRVLEAHGLRQPALDCFGHAARFEPAEPRWPYLRGSLLATFEDPEKALPDLRRAVELAAQVDRSNSVPRLRLAETLLAVDRPAEAEEHLRQVLREEPDNARVHYALGLLALAQKDGAAAEEHLTRAARSPHARQKACAQLARLFQQQGNETAAAEFSRRAAQPPSDQPWSDPYVLESASVEKGPWTRFREASRLGEGGQTEEMIQALQELNRESPSNRSALALGTALAKLGDLPGAEAAFRQALGQGELQVPAHFSLGVALYEQGKRLWDRPGQREAARKKVQEAVTHFQRARELKPDHALAHFHHGLAVQLLGQPQEALRSYRLSIECRPERVEGHLQLGKLLAEQGQWTEAARALEQAVPLSDASDSRARQALEQVQAHKVP